MKFYKFITDLYSEKAGLVILIDPDKFSPELIPLAEKNHACCFFVGGSKLKKNNIASVIRQIKKLSDLPVIIFPGDEQQVSEKADGILILSLISGRNPEYLIGKLVRAAEKIKKAQLPFLPVGYMLVNGGKVSGTQKITGTQSIKAGHLKEAKNTSIAGELLGLRAIYLEAGSGARNSVPAKMIREVKKNIHTPLIVGGGIDSAKKARLAVKAGASLVVVGNALERSPELIKEIGKIFK